MSWELDADLVDAIAQALLTDPGRGPGAQAGKLLTRVAVLGWMENWLLDDLLHASDRRLVTGMSGVDVEAIASAVDLRPASVTQRPRVGSTGAMMLDARWAYDSASLLILLEDMGFAIDPRPLVNAIKPSIPKRGLITASQLDVLWYDVRRLARTVEFRAPGPVRTREIEDRKLSTGHKLEIHRDADGRALALTIRGPRHRRRAEPVETKCPDCGYVWYRGDPDSSAGHRREHKKRMVFLDSAPDPRVLEAREAEPEPELVTYESEGRTFESFRARQFFLENTGTKAAALSATGLICGLKRRLTRNVIGTSPFPGDHSPWPAAARRRIVRLAA